MILNTIFTILMGLICIEAFWDYKRKGNLYDRRDSIQCLYLLSLSLVIFNSLRFLMTYVDPLMKDYVLITFDSVWIKWSVLFVVYDFVYYWIHRLEHTGYFWKISHVHHHSSRRLNFLTGFRASYLQPLYSIPFLIPFYFMGFTTLEIFSMVTINKFYNFWVHQQHIKKLGFIDKIFVTPSNHRVHHGRNAQYIDKNMGGVFIIWDKLFGTYEPEVEEVKFGVHKDPIDLGVIDNLKIGL